MRTIVESLRTVWRPFRRFVKMSRRGRAIAIRTAMVIAVVLGVTLGILSRPQQVQGVYTASQLIQCLCDGSHYLRFHNGLVAHYSTSHGPAELLGRYEVGPDGSVAVYQAPLHKNDPESILFTLGRPRLGFAIASAPDGNKSCILTRLPITRKIADLIARQNVTQVTFTEERTLVTTFYDSSFAVVRQEEKPIKKRREGHAAAPDQSLPSSEK